MKLFQTIYTIVAAASLSVILIQNKVEAQECNTHWLPSITPLQMFDGQRVIEILGGVTSDGLTPAVDIWVDGQPAGRHELPVYLDGKNLWVGFGRLRLTGPRAGQKRRTIFYCGIWRPINNP